MADDLKKGDHVTWKSHGGTAEGTVERKITSDTEASGRTVRASKDEPAVRGDAARRAGAPRCTSPVRCTRTDPRPGGAGPDSQEAP